jgi:hypothetical protein
VVAGGEGLGTALLIDQDEMRSIGAAVTGLAADQAASRDHSGSHCQWQFRSVPTCAVAGPHSAGASVPPKQ